MTFTLSSCAAHFYEVSLNACDPGNEGDSILATNVLRDAQLSAAIQLRGPCRARMARRRQGCARAASRRSKAGIRSAHWRLSWIGTASQSDMAECV